MANAGACDGRRSAAGMGVYELVRSEDAAGPALDLEAGRCGPPPTAKASPAAPRQQRLVSLDVFRGITVLIAIVAMHYGDNTS
uniref:Heparan-alpha-glucosaminide N-acetyltransferase catalytic domain-containing protein n=1 Tax=Aegilops tauschii TaxID=37682 RepID=M8BCD7_AEGTA